VILGLNLIDWLIILLVIVVAYTGWTHGLVVGLLSFVGFVGGAAAGLLLVPRLLGGLGPGLGVSVLAVILVLIVASIGQGLLAWAGSWVRSKVSSAPARNFDAAGGALLGVAGLLIAAWAVGLAVSTAAIPHASSAVRGSTILRAVDSVVPVSPDEVQNAFSEVVAAGGFPEVVAPWVPEPIHEVDAPNTVLIRDAEVRTASESVLKVIGRAPTCDRVIEGSGFVIAAELIMTNAHVVAGVADPVIDLADADPMAASVVLFDPETDIAVLHVPGLPHPPLAFAEEGPADSADAAVIGYPNNGPLDTEAVRVRSEQRLLGRDIYGQDQVTREVVSLRGNIRPGNSGGPLVSLDGTVLGLIFASSLTDPDTGYALALTEVRETLETLPDERAAVSTGGCTE
jgi:S1-C subfamily serine protease